MLPDTSHSGKRKAPANAARELIRRFSGVAAMALDTRCLVCGARTRGPLCQACFHDLPWNDHACRLCARPLPELPGTLCGDCARKSPDFAGAHAAFAYAWPLDRLIQRFKFGGDLATGRVMARALAEYLDLHQVPRPDLLIPVPLHRRRLAERGFNQAAEIGRILAASLGTHMAFDRLDRVQATPAQSGLDRVARQRNLRHAFACPRPVTGLHVAVVDDVITTGSTAQAAAYALKQAGAVEVHIYALARA